MTFRRLTRGHVVALVAALALLPVMALDWYGTDAGDEARQIQKDTSTGGATSGEVGRAVEEDARIIAEKSESTAWQADAFADRLILFLLLAAGALAIAAAWLRAAGARFKPPWTPSALAAIVGLIAVLLLAARIVQKPDADPGSNVKAGAPLGLICAGAIVLGSRAAWNAERDPADRKPRGNREDTDEQDAVRPGDEEPAPAPLFDREQA